MRVLLDVNVCLDVLLDRAPFAGSSGQLWALAERGKAAGLVPAHGMTTIHYVVAKARDAATARRFVSDSLRVFRVAAVDEAVLKRALELAMPDFEDAVCAAAAEAAGCDLVVTRDPKGYGRSPVTAVDPATALALLEGGGPGVAEGRARCQARGKRTAVRTRRGRGVARGAG